MEDLPASPGPLGYLSLGIGLVTISLFQASFFDFGILAPLVALFAGAALLLAALLAQVARKTLELTAFALLGMFWLSMGTIWAIDLFEIGPRLDHGHIAWYLVLWAVVGIVLSVANRRRSFAVQVVYAALALWFLLMAVAELTGGAIVAQMAGFEGLMAGALSMYLGTALLLNESAGRTVLPIGEPYISKIIIPDDISQLFD